MSSKSKRRLPSFHSVKGFCAPPVKHRIIKQWLGKDIYRDLTLERAHFLVPLCQKYSFIRGQEAKETGNQYLGFWYLNWERKSLTCYFYCGMMLEILHLVSIIIQYFGGCRFKKPLQGSHIESEHKAERNVHTYILWWELGKSQI